MAKIKVKIEGREVLYMFLGFLFLVTWFLWLKNLVAPFLEEIPPIIAFVIYNIGIVGALFAISSVFQVGKQRFKFAIVAILIGMGIDIIIAPYLVTTHGSIITNVDYWYVSTDAAFGSLYASFIPNIMVPLFNVSLRWIITYIVTPFLFVFLLPVIITDPKAIKKILGGNK